MESPDSQANKYNRFHGGLFVACSTLALLFRAVYKNVFEKLHFPSDGQVGWLEVA